MRRYALVAILRLNPLRPELTRGLSGADSRCWPVYVAATSGCFGGDSLGRAIPLRAPLRVVYRRRCLRA